MRFVPLQSVTVHDGFWRDRIEANRTVAIPRLLDRLVAHGVVDNFRPGSERRGLWFTDSDLYKWMEAAAWSLAAHPDPALAERLEDVIEIVLGAQEDDGYLNTNFSRETRFADLSWSHELYCAGHFIQVAIAHCRATGRVDMIDAAVRFADLIATTFAARTDRDRHPVIEMALVELAREIGDDRYRAAAAMFCDRVPHAGWSRLWGHAVCALYFASGCTDLALDGDSDRAPRVERWWDDLVTRSSYVTGGVGGRWLAESTGRPFELPHEGAYAESCGAVAALQWAERMLRLTGDAAVGDQIELIAHNALAASVSLDGDAWFYANPLASSAIVEEEPFIGDTLALQIAGPMPLERCPWRDVTCCPPNVTRALASLAASAYLYNDDELRVVWYLPSRVRVGEFDVEIATGMPWSGDVTVTVHAAPARETAITLRIPGWSAATDRGTWRVLRRRWKAGETVNVDLGVDVELLAANPRVAECRDAVAVRRGPFVYCAEGVDHPGVDVNDLALDPEASFDAQWESELLGGTVVLRGRASEQSWDGPLYQALDRGGVSLREVPLTLVPYARWANRGAGSMTVWFPRARS